MTLDQWTKTHDSSNIFAYAWDELSGRSQREEQNQWEQEQSNIAYQRDMQMWQMQNEYNSPSAQMARYQAAGLNPNLIYGQGSSGNASSAPSYKPASGVGRPTGLDTFQKIVGVISTLIGLKGQLASADAAAQRAKNLSITNLSLPGYLGLRNQFLRTKDEYLSSNLWAPHYTDSNGNPVFYKSYLDLYNAHPESFFERPLNFKFLQDETNARLGLSLFPYQDQIKNAELIRLQRINSLLGQQNQFFKLDKYIGYGTDLLNGLLQFGNFGLGLKKFNFTKSLYY